MFVFLDFCRRDGSADIKQTCRYAKILDTSDEAVEVFSFHDIAEVADRGYKLLFYNYPRKHGGYNPHDYSIFLHKKDNNYTFVSANLAYAPILVSSVEEALRCGNGVYTLSYTDLKVMLKYKDFNVRYIFNCKRDIYRPLIPDSMWGILGKIKLLSKANIRVAGGDLVNKAVYHYFRDESCDGDSKPFVTLVAMYFYDKNSFEQVHKLLTEKMKLLGKEYTLLVENDIPFGQFHGNYSNVLLSERKFSLESCYKELLLCYRRDVLDKYLAKFDKWMTGYDLLKL